MDQNDGWYDFEWEEQAARNERFWQTVKIVIGAVLLLMLTCA
ncbi:MAG: hypothetical protein V1907_03750 [Candidatus Kerfeldbacteria bacterium]